MDLLTALWLGFIGACVGSFLNVVAYRVPRGMSVIWKPSHCPACGRPVRPRDNLPVLGWLLLRGRCRDCRAPISPRYAVVEALVGALAVLLAYAELFTGAANIFGGPLTPFAGALNTVINPNWEVITLYAFHMAVFSLLTAYVLIDADGQRIPRALAVVALAVLLVCAYRWRFLYPERARAIRVRDWRAPVDALQGMFWLAAPLAAGAVAFRVRGRPDVAWSLGNLAAGAALAGGAFGIRAMVRIAVLAAVAAPIVIARRRRGRRASCLAVVTLAALVHLLFWKQLAALASW